MMNLPKTRLLYYCQSLVGIGHLTASLQIIQALLPNFDVDLIYGGINYPNFPRQTGFRVLELPTLLFDDQGELYHSQSATPVDSVWQQRQTCIDRFLHSTYHAIVLEFYPFGRRRFKQEIRSLCKQVKATSGAIPVFSQVREVLVPTTPAEEENILRIVEQEIDMVLVRGDPKVVALAETFALAPALGERLFYGGYVSQAAPLQFPQRRQQIVVSQGGGNVGRALLGAAIAAAALLPEYQFMIVTGSTASAQDIEALQALVQSNNVKVMAFLANFREHLLMSALSINMGGDNTLLDVIATRTPSLAFPYPGNSEQTIRIHKLAAHGWVSALSENDLQPQAFKKIILQTLAKPYPTSVINLNGAVNISNKIQEVIATRG